MMWYVLKRNYLNFTVHFRTKKLNEITLHIFSDATGGLARHILDSVLSQFPNIEYQLVLHVFQGKIPEIKRALKEIDTENSLVVYAFVSEKPRKAIEKICEKEGAGVSRDE